VVVAVSLTLAAGFVDAFGFLTLSGVYTANMSGNTVLIGVHALTDRANALLHAFTIAMFVVGLVTSGVIIEAGLRRRIRRSFATRRRRRTCTSWGWCRLAQSQAS
jgi:uncharacterized membrane protein YoaK (UPF0700 family)